MTPGRYFYKSLKWVRKIEVMAQDVLGYWERTSQYHQVGDPWAGDQRFATGSLPPDRLARFRDAQDFRRYRGPLKVMIGIDLVGWSPRGRDLRALELKNCDLRGADLHGVDLRDANLSLSDLRGGRLARL